MDAEFNMKLRGDYLQYGDQLGSVYQQTCGENPLDNVPAGDRFWSSLEGFSGVLLTKHQANETFNVPSAYRNYLGSKGCPEGSPKGDLVKLTNDYTSISNSLKNQAEEILNSAASDKTKSEAAVFNFAANQSGNVKMALKGELDIPPEQIANLKAIANMLTHSPGRPLLVLKLLNMIKWNVKGGLRPAHESSMYFSELVNVTYRILATSWAGLSKPGEVIANLLNDLWSLVDLNVEEQDIADTLNHALNQISLNLEGQTRENKFVMQLSRELMPSELPLWPSLREAIPILNYKREMEKRDLVNELISKYEYLSRTLNEEVLSKKSYADKFIFKYGANEAGNIEMALKWGKVNPKRLHNLRIIANLLVNPANQKKLIFDLFKMLKWDSYRKFKVSKYFGELVQAVASIYNPLLRKDPHQFLSLLQYYRDTLSRLADADTNEEQVIEGLMQELIIEESKLKSILKDEEEGEGSGNNGGTSAPPISEPSGSAPPVTPHALGLAPMQGVANSFYPLYMGIPAYKGLQLPPNRLLTGGRLLWKPANTMLFTTRVGL